MNRRWCSADNALLIEWWNRGDCNVVAIADGLDRTPEAVRRQMEKLRHRGLIGAPAQAYLPESGLRVPCRNCGTAFNRTRVTACYCSRDCLRAAARVPVQQWKKRTDGICPRCGVNPRSARPDGRLRGWCRPCESVQKSEYLRTEAGKTVMRRYQRSPKGRAAAARRLAARKAAQS